MATLPINFNKARRLETTANKLKQQGIEFVRVLFCDNTNLIRAKAFHLETLAEHWRSPVSIDPGSMTPGERQRLNIQALPNHLGTAIACLKKMRCDSRGLTKAFLAVRKAEWDVLQGKSLEEDVNLLLTKY